jgi:hypothetical protein
MGGVKSGSAAYNLDIYVELAARSEGGFEDAQDVLSKCIFSFLEEIYIIDRNMN